MRNKWIALLPLILALMLGVWWWQGAGSIRSSSALVRAFALTVSPRLDGYVVDVAVREGDRVKAGQTLLRLDSSALKSALAREEAKLALLESDMPRPVGGSAVPAPGPDTLRRDEERARQEVERLSTVQASTAVALSRLRNRGADANALRAAEDNDRAARSALAEAKDRLENAGRDRARLERRQTLSRLTGSSPEADAALYAAQKAAVDEARHNLEAAALRAPADGVVLFRDADPGRLLHRGHKALTLLPSGPEHIWIDAVFPKSAASRLRPGQPCSVAVDGYTGPKLAGVIGGILPQDPNRQDKAGEADTVRAHVLLSSYDPASMPLLPVNEKARVTVYTRAAAEKKASGAGAAGVQNATAAGSGNATAR